MIDNKIKQLNMKIEYGSHCFGDIVRIDFRHS